MAKSVDNSSINSIPASTLLKKALDKIHNMQTIKRGDEFVKAVRDAFIDVFDGHLNFHKDTHVLTGPGYKSNATSFNTLYLIYKPQIDQLTDMIVRYVGKNGISKELRIICKSSRGNVIEWQKSLSPRYNDIIIMNVSGASRGMGQVTMFKGNRIIQNSFTDNLVEEYENKIQQYINKMSIEINQQLNAGSNAFSSVIQPKFVPTPYFSGMIRSNSNISNIKKIDSVYISTPGKITNPQEIVKASMKRRLYFNEVMLIANALI